MALVSRLSRAPARAAAAPSRLRGRASALEGAASLGLAQLRAARGRHRCFGAQVMVSSQRFEEFIKAEMSFMAKRQPQPLKLEQIVHASTPGKVAGLVLAELPYRFAFRIKHLESHPNFEGQPELEEIRDIFSRSFRDLRLVEPIKEEQTAEELAEFSEVIYALRRRHQPVTALLAEALRKMHPHGSLDDKVQEWADVFLHSRVTTEMLTSHYVAIVEGSSEHSAEAMSSGRVGIVDTKCNPGEICKEAAEMVREAFLARRGVNIQIDIKTNNCSYANAEIEFSYIPRYLFYILQELLRNSARATVEASGNSPEELATRPITITVCADKKEVALRISDQGGGVPFEHARQIWSYTFSTSKLPYKEYAGRASPLSGWGMGLPASRLYASYLGGRLELMNMPGTGVDAYLFLKRISLD